ncbi:MAG: 4-hydroxy-tetrahydrodipicolinate reductase [Phenylobacterium sp.]|uniref:4-hydroxy-tetrahydrodipicolinate reductase n=1 Tax=Phenylobacterium sp. TaxID=1871053 RepID=UPI0012186348|nr:4-hydroxy-tetrahydrodipicolinate reductase [Phenylobacterium sp.]TAL35892.1 MAG: 4-hydroxy-tetrahydrodipicolinate reductase [Phenylobacterium sp.]
MSDPIRIAIAGALGRMGQAVEKVVRADPALALVARFDRPGAEGDGLVSAAEALDAAQVVIDFTTPAASVALTAQAAGKPVALVIGATGASDAERAAIAQAAARNPIVFAGNYSLGVNLLMGLVAQAARALPADLFDIEVFEAHHRHKVDAPSGTAFMLGEAAARGRGVRLSQVERRARDGITGARPSGEIGFSVVRGGGIVGEHSVIFAGEEEILTLSHSGRDRGLFARGAVAAARWVADKPPGLYDMQDVLGMKDA